MNGDLRLIGDALPTYEIGDKLGQGGWGVVTAGRHRRLNRQVAIKQLPAAFAADPDVRRRFTEEARVLASLDHPHVVPVYDFVEREGLCLLVMELLPGGTLRSRITAGELTSARSVAITLACAAGLNAAHERGVLHRDVKPENMMFAGTGAIKVTDFGIAKVVGGSATLATREGDVLGTPAYIAPEQARGGELSPATDVYALATILYELLSGILPFTDDGNAIGLLFKHAHEAPVPLSDVAPSVPAAVAAVVMRGLATDPADRFASAESFGVALAGACTGVWGPGWLSVEPVPLMGAAAIIAASERTSAAPPIAVTAVSRIPLLRPAPREPDTRSSTPPRRPPSLIERPSPSSMRRARLDDVATAELVPVQEVVSTPPAPAPDAPGSTATPPPAGAVPPSTSSEPRSEASPEDVTVAAGRRMDPHTRRVVGIIVVVVVIVVVVILLAPRLFTGYQESGQGPLPTGDGRAVAQPYGLAAIADSGP